LNNDEVSFLEIRLLQMKRTIITGLLLLAGTVFPLPAFGAGKEAEFFSGVFLLQSTTALTAEQKAVKYLELQMMTGITGASAKALLAAYRDKPEEWQRLSGSINTLLTEVKPPSPAPGAGTEQKTAGKETILWPKR
jgi:hypothetical protein